MDLSLRVEVPSDRCDDLRGGWRAISDFRISDFRAGEILRTVCYFPCRPCSPRPLSSGRNLDFSLKLGVASDRCERFVRRLQAVNFRFEDFRFQIRISFLIRVICAIRGGFPLGENMGHGFRGRHGESQEGWLFSVSSVFSVSHSNR